MQKKALLFIQLAVNFWNLLLQEAAEPANSRFTEFGSKTRWDWGRNTPIYFLFSTPQQDSRRVSEFICRAVRKRSVGAPGTMTSLDNRGRLEDGVWTLRVRRWSTQGYFPVVSLISRLVKVELSEEWVKEKRSKVQSRAKETLMIWLSKQASNLQVSFSHFRSQTEPRAQKSSLLHEFFHEVLHFRGWQYGKSERGKLFSPSRYLLTISLWVKHKPVHMVSLQTHTQLLTLLKQQARSLRPEVTGTQNSSGGSSIGLCRVVYEVTKQEKGRLRN